MSKDHKYVVDLIQVALDESSRNGSSGLFWLMTGMVAAQVDAGHRLALQSAADDENTIEMIRLLSEIRERIDRCVEGGQSR